MNPARGQPGRCPVVGREDVGPVEPGGQLPTFGRSDLEDPLPTSGRGQLDRLRPNRLAVQVDFDPALDRFVGKAGHFQQDLTPQRIGETTAGLEPGDAHVIARSAHWDQFYVAATCKLGHAIEAAVAEDNDSERTVACGETTGEAASQDTVGPCDTPANEEGRPEAA